MDLKQLFIPYEAVASVEKSSKVFNTSFLDEFLEKPVISEDNKDRAKRVTESLEVPQEEPEYSYQDSWKGIPHALPTSDYTKIPSDWEDYSRLLPAAVKAKAKKARDFFMKRLSLTKEQASGITGVLISETNLNPASYNKNEKENKSYYGAGIGSWTFSKTKDRIKGLLSTISGKDKGEIENYSLDEQLEAYAQDLEGHPAIFKLLKKAVTVDDAADIVTRGIENGGMSGKLVTKEWFDKGYHWTKGSDAEGNPYTNHYEAAMYNVNPKYAIGRIISSRLTYSLK